MARFGVGLLRVGILVTAVLGVALAQTLTLSSTRQLQKDFYEDIARRFEAKTGTKVVYISCKNTEYNTILASARVAGSGPDIIHTRAYGGLAQLADGCDR